MSGVKRLLITPAFRAAIEEAARNVYGHLPIVNHRTGNKLFRRRPVMPIRANYYVEENTRLFKQATKGEYKTPEEERWKRALEKLKRRGKGPPKKGHGKRSAKKK